MDEKDALKELSNQLSQSIYLSEICNSDGIAAINAKKAEFLSCINRIIQGQKNDILLLKHISEQMPKEMLALTNANKKLQAENAELKARLDKAVELPCKVGDTVYMVFDGLIKVLIVESIHCWKSGKWRISAHTDKTNKYWAGYEIDPKGFGIKFFLAEAEAQAKLEEMKGGAE